MPPTSSPAAPREVHKSAVMVTAVRVTIGYTVTVFAPLIGPPYTGNSSDTVTVGFSDTFANPNLQPCSLVTCLSTLTFGIHAV